jgi:hypothetical protein
MKIFQNLPKVAFELEAQGDFDNALKIWKRKKTFSSYSGAYVRAAELARVLNNQKLMQRLILKFNPVDIRNEFGTNLGENLTIEWIKQRGRFDLDWEVSSRIIAKLWETDGEISLGEINKYCVLPIHDILPTNSTSVTINKPHVENQSIFRIFRKSTHERIRIESRCLDLSNAIAVIGSNSFIVKDKCLVDEFRSDFPQIATCIDDPLIFGIRDREALIPKYQLESARLIHKAFWLGLKYSSEHGHFVSTVLTRLYYFEKHVDWGKAPVIISSKLSRTHRDILKLMYPSINFLEIQEGFSINFAHLVVAPTSVFSPTTVNEVSNPPDWVFIDIEEFEWLHAKFDNIQTASSQLPKKIGIVRNGYNRRRLVNAYDWEKLALASGYSLIDPAVLSAEEEISLFKNATHIIGENGSWLYLSGLNPESQIIVLIHDKDYTSWNEISQLNALRRTKLKIVRGRRILPWYYRLNMNNLNSEWMLTKEAKRKMSLLIQQSGSKD